VECADRSVVGTHAGVGIDGCGNDVAVSLCSTLPNNHILPIDFLVYGRENVDLRIWTLESLIPCHAAGAKSTVLGVDEVYAIGAEWTTLRRVVGEFLEVDDGAVGGITCEFTIEGPVFEAAVALKFEMATGEEVALETLSSWYSVKGNFDMNMGHVIEVVDVTWMHDHNVVVRQTLSGLLDIGLGESAFYRMVLVVDIEDLYGYAYG